MLLFVDTETTGFVDHDKGPEWEGQPHLIQLAAILSEHDGRERATLNVVVELPEDIKVPVSASKVHGITDEVAARSGVTLQSAIGLLYRMSQKADAMVCHNVEFDQMVLRAAAVRVGVAEVTERFSTIPTHCTKEIATPVLNLPPTPKMVRAGRTHPKSPNLAECVLHFFDEDLEGAHDAMVDVRACKRVYFALNPHP